MNEAVLELKDRLDRLDATIAVATDFAATGDLPKVISALTNMTLDTARAVRCLLWIAVRRESEGAER